MAMQTDEVASLFTDLVDCFGGIAVTVNANPTGTANTKAISATGCLRKSLVRATESGLDRDTCTYVIPATQFASGFSTTNPVTPATGMTITVSGESPWIVTLVESVSDAVYVLRTVGA